LTGQDRKKVAKARAKIDLLDHSIKCGEYKKKKNTNKTSFFTSRLMMPLNQCPLEGIKANVSGLNFHLYFSLCLCSLCVANSACLSLQRHYTENSQQIFPEKELRGLNPNFYIHVSVSDLYIPTIGLPILSQENMWTDPGNI
jgi:hypothetical protein